MKILIIGGTGVLSTAVAKEAISLGVNVTMINRGNRIERIPQGAHLIKSDRRNIPLIKEQLKGHQYDAVIDFLCSTKRDTLDSIELYSKYAKQYFYISSAAVVNPNSGKILYEDSPKPYNVWDYSVNKWDSENALVSRAKELNVNFTIVRPSITYDFTRIPYDIMPTYGYHWTLIERIKHQKPIILINGGQSKHSIMRVEDFANALCGLIGKSKAYNEVFNICGDEAPTFKEVLDVVSDIINVKPITVDIPSWFVAKELPSRKGEILGGRSVNAVHSNEKLKSVVTTFSQKIFLREGVEMTINAYKEDSYQKGIDWKYEGDIDRVICAWEKYNHVKGSYKLGFVDYFGNATSEDKKLYYQCLKSNSFPYKQISFIKYVFKRFRNIPNRIRREIFRLINK